MKQKYLDASELEKIKIPPGLKLGQRVWVDSVFGVYECAITACNLGAVPTVIDHGQHCEDRPGTYLAQAEWAYSLVFIGGAYHGKTYGDFVPESEILTERPEDAPELRDIPELVVSNV